MVSQVCQCQRKRLAMDACKPTARIMRTPTTLWLSCNANGSLERPAEPEASTYKLFGEAEMLTPFRHAHSAAVEREAPGARAVVSLLLSCSPVAIVWCVITVVVAALKAGADWARAHVGQEDSERMKPTVTDGYSATTVPAVAGCLGVCASPFHGEPTAIFRASRALKSRVSMCFWAAFDALGTFAHPKVRTYDVRLCSALAAAYPLRLPGAAVTIGPPKNRPATKPSASQINQTSHLLPLFIMYGCLLATWMIA